MCENMPVSNRSVGGGGEGGGASLALQRLPRQGPRVWVDQGRLVATEAVRAGAFMAQVGGAGEDGANLPPLYTDL